MEEIKWAPAEQKKKIKKSLFATDEDLEEEDERKPQRVSAFKRGEGVVLEVPKEEVPHKPVDLVLQPNGNWFERLHKNIYTTTKQDPSNDDGDVYDSDEGEELPLEEGLIYARDVEARPDEPEMDTYQKLSMNDFQKAMLRNMGVVDEAKEVEDRAEIRPNLLGFGAKVTEEATELGAWGKGARGKVDAEYVPVQRVNKKTGDVENNIRHRRERSRERRQSYYSSNSRTRSRREVSRDRSPRRDSDGGHEKYKKLPGSRGHSNERRFRRKYHSEDRRNGIR